MEGQISLFIATAAFVVSLFGYVHQRSTARHELLATLCDAYLGETQQRGRRILFQARDDARIVTDLSEDEFHAVNHALASMELIAYLHARHGLSRRDAQEIFGRTASRLVTAATEIGFLELRDQQYGQEIWPYLRKFAELSRPTP